LAEGSPRVPALEPGDYPERLQHFLSGLVDSGLPPAVTELNVVRTLANHPDLAIAYMSFGTYVLGRSSLPGRIRELTTLRTAWLWNSRYEWDHHARQARRRGMTAEQVDATRIGSDAPCWDELDRHVLLAIEQLHRSTTIEDDVWDGLSRHLDQHQLLDFLFAVGCYVTLAMALNSLRVTQEG
jgi:4-carboxymuconolactone decarboxylase